MLTQKEIELIEENAALPASEVALRLRATPNVRPQVVATQIDCRQRLRAKVPSWLSARVLFIPTSLATQQCSSEGVARHRATLVEGDTLVDLTGGLGVDCYFMSQNVKSAIHTEPNGELQEAVRHNFTILGANNVTFANTTAEDQLAHMTEGIGTIFIDPSRRSSSGSKVFRLEDCTPDVTKMAEEMAAKAHVVLIKLSSMLDIAQAANSLPYVTDIYVVGTPTECKDLLVRMCKTETKDEPTLHAVTIEPTGTWSEMAFKRSDEAATTVQLATDVIIGNYLFEPSPVIMKAGPYSTLCLRHGARQVSLKSHIYIAEHDIEDFPGRRFKIIDVADLSKRGIKLIKEKYPRAAITARGASISAEGLRKKIGLADDDKTFIFCVNHNGADTLFICQKATPKG